LLASICLFTGVGAIADPISNEILVEGQRQRGSVEGDIRPEIQLGSEDIRALGASSIAEMLAELAPQTGSFIGSGEPVVLLNGRRISGFGEIRALPPESIERIDILPPEVALKYGYRPTSRVVNIVLRDRVRTVTAELKGSVTTDGGGATGGVDLGLLRVGDIGRTSVNGSYQHLAELLQNQRDIALLPGETLDTRPFQSLSPEKDQLAFDATINRRLAGGVSATLSGQFGDTTTRSGVGAIEAISGPIPLERTTEVRSEHLGLALNGDLTPWRWSFTANGDHSHSRSDTDNSAGERDRVRAVDRSIAAELVLTGPLFRLPAGEVRTTLNAGFEFSGFDGDSTLSGVTQSSDLTRDTVNAQASLDIPITSRSGKSGRAIGELSLNLNLAGDHLSDFGTLTALGYGLQWSPVPQLQLIASVRRQDGAPGLPQLGNPALATPNARVFDMSRDETANITLIEGGNRALTREVRRIVTFSGEFRPSVRRELTFHADYVRLRSRNAVSAFPMLTPAIEAAFPDRVVRDGSGQLLGIDTRPINLANTSYDALRWGFDLAAPIGPKPPDGATGSRARLQLALYDTWYLRARAQLITGLPELDLLNGATIGSRGGQPRHALSGQLGISRNGLGARLTAAWTSATTVRANPLGPPAAGDLHFSDLATFNLLMFVDLDERFALARHHPWLRGVRLRIALDNMFNARLRVHDRSGSVPIGYEPDLLDPLGRTISISVRKQFG
jgi:hypothetical protein